MHFNMKSIDRQKARNPTQATELSWETIEADQDIRSWSATWLEQAARNSLPLDGQESIYAGALSVTEDFCTEKHNNSSEDHNSSGPKDNGSKTSCTIGPGLEPSHNLSVDAKAPPISLEIGLPSPTSLAQEHPGRHRYADHFGNSSPPAVRYSQVPLFEKSV